MLKPLLTIKLKLMSAQELQRLVKTWLRTHTLIPTRTKKMAWLIFREQLSAKMCQGGGHSWILTLFVCRLLLKLLTLRLVITSLTSWMPRQMCPMSKRPLSIHLMRNDGERGPRQAVGWVWQWLKLKWKWFKKENSNKLTVFLPKNTRLLPIPKWDTQPLLYG